VASVLTNTDDKVDENHIPKFTQIHPFAEKMAENLNSNL
jgi:hypothetical protein